ncbi:MAG: serine hydrolase domain-containing protein [Pseudomonadota bacterium]
MSKIRDLFAKWAGSDQPGVALAVAMGKDAPFEVHCVGTADLSADRPITPQSVFHYCSVSKLFTAAAWCVLAHRGEVDLDAPIAPLLPELPRADGITARSLLNMTAGLQDSEEVLCFANVLTRLPGIHRTWIAHALGNETRAFAPGAGSSYTNTHYILMSHALERATGAAFGDAVRRLVLDPVGAGGIHLRSDPRQVTPHLARGYVPTGDGSFADGLAFGFLGGGGFVGTLDDLCRFLGAFARDDLQGVPIRSMMTRRPTLSNGTPTSYGLGCFVHPWRGLTVQGHNGGMAGYKTWAAFVPDLNWSIAFLSNRDDAQSSQHLRALLDIALQGRASAPARPSIPDEARRALRRLEGEWMCPATADHFTLSLEDSHIALNRMGFPSRLRACGGGVYADDWFTYTTVLRDLKDGTRLMLSTHGQKERLYVRPAPEQKVPDELAGSYVAPDHGLHHRISVEDGEAHLHLCRNRWTAPVFAVRPLGHDCYAIDRARSGQGLRRGFRVMRDEDGRISGLTYIGPRLHGLTLQASGNVAP